MTNDRLQMTKRARIKNLSKTLDPSALIAGNPANAHSGGTLPHAHLRELQARAILLDERFQASHSRFIPG
jgi:rRNA maturation endonuclease Nob1